MRNLKWNEIFRRSMATLLAFAMVFGMLPSIPFAHVHAEGEEAAQQTETSFAGKTVSILSHSISTYAGVSNNSAYNSTIGNNDVYYTAGRHGVYREDTWWQQAIDALGMELLVNNSWSGSCVFMPRKGEASVGYGDRAVNLHNDSTGQEPDIIWVYLGCNDFAYYKDTFGTAEDIDYAALILDNGDGTFAYSEPQTTCEAYAIMLHKVENRYPDAEIYCMTSTARRDPDYADNYADTGQPTAYSAELHKVAAYFGFPVIDLENAIPKDAEIFDQYMGDKRAHANALGMDQITNAVLSVMLGRSAEIRHVTSESGAVAEQAVLLDGSYSAEIELPEGYSPVVTMDGRDVTSEAYKDGNITIEKVTGDIEIGLKRAEKNFRWELNDDVFETVTGYSFSENTLTLLEGSIENGIFSGVKYALSDNIYLYHDQPWIVEWACTGNWDATLFANVDKGGVKGAEVLFRSSTDCNLLAIGEYDGTQYNNYGIATGDLDLDMTQRHVYRLENRVSADGNMVWLYIDGTEIGPMDNYYIGSRNDTGYTSDWVSGRDFAFGYMGTVVRAINDCSLEYVEVWEAGHTHTYEKDICTGCGAEDPEYVDFTGKTVSILGASTATYAGVSNNTADNSTIGKNAVYYTEGRHGVYLKDTWWQQVIDALGMRLLVNNSWSGSCVFMPRQGEASVGYGDRAVNLHNDHTGEEPDIILVYIGGNDFAYYKDTFGKAVDVDYSALIQDNGDGTFSYAEPATTCEAYAIMLHKIENRYPEAQIYCMTSAARRDPDYAGDNYPDSGQPTEYNAELQKVAEHFGFPVIDLENAIAKEAETFDKYMGDKRAHPNALGMDQFSNEVLSVLLGKEAEIRHVTSEDDIVKEQAVLLGGSYSGEVAVPEGYTLSVVMNGKDITEEAYANGTIFIGEVTGDIEVSAKRGPVNFRWELVEDAFVSVTTGGNTENPLTMDGGNISNGAFSNVRGTLEKSVYLYHDRPWVLEWSCTGDYNATLFTSSNKSASVGMRYLFRANNASGLIAFGEYNGSQHNNYGVVLSEYDIDMSTEHIYRLENRIAQDGTNMVYLLVDGIELGAMNHYYIGSTSDQGVTSDWLNGEDFVFDYIGSSGRPINNCSIGYLQVWENGEPSDALSLRYDDHYDVTGKTVEIVDAGKPTSYKVGYGVAEGTLDDAVVTLEGDTLVATGIGTAQVRIDGQLYEVTVTAAPISLLLLIGQSNMRGSEGNADQSIVCPDGMVYATFGDDRGDAAGIMNVNNATKFAASALTGEYSTVNVEGTTEHLSFYPINSLTEAGAGTFGPDSGFAYEWVKQTGEKVWVVNAAHGGSAIKSWQEGATNYKECVLLFSACQETLRKEIAAGHFTLSHMGYFWCQGCSDASMTAEQYVEKYLAMHESLKSALAFDHDSDETTEQIAFEFAGIIPVRAGNATSVCYREGEYTDTTDAKYHESFKDLRFTGPRVAQYWMCNNPELEDIWMVCNIGEDWVWMPDGTNGVSEYFQAHYENGTVDYTTQVQQSASWYTPTTPKAVHDSVHYNQIGYNEIGREAARNALIMLGEVEAPEVETTVEFLGWDGYTQIGEVPASTTGQSSTLVVPKVYPLWNAKSVTYQLSEGLRWEYYDLLTTDVRATGTLTAGDQTVAVVKADPYAYFSAHLAELPENVCGSLNLWDVLEHDEYYYASGTGWGTHSSKNVPSVTFLLNPGDRLYASSFGAAGTNGHATSNGIRMTFFGEYEVVKTTGPSDTYAEFAANGGYLVAPEGTVAVNIPMWGDSDQWEIYILNREHIYDAVVTLPTCKADGYTTHTCVCGDSYKDSYVATNGEHTYEAVVIPPTCAEQGYTTHTCPGCGVSYVDSYVDPTGQHSFGPWTATKVPSETSLGEEQRACTVCGLTETQEVEGVWQKYDLAAHLLDLPEHVCCDTNLWASLPHESVHFTSGKKWGVTGTPTTSITIPVNPGDRIYATSWNKAGENGHETSDGIRLTFFDAYGIALTLGPGESYWRFAANGGYLAAPEGTIAINIVMWYDSADYEVYILNREHSYDNGICLGCGGLDPDWIESLHLRYDDHYDVTGKTVEIVDAGTPTSYKVGYGVAEGTLDDAVVTLEGDTLVATGIGTARVSIDGIIYEVTVTAAPLNVLLLIGQSNMQGSEGNAAQSIVCPDGLVYSTYGDRYTMTVSNATNFAPSALTGEGSTVNVNGTTANLKDWPVYLLNEAGDGKIGPDSGFAYEWVQQTGEKVWVINAAHGGTNISLWQENGKEYKECKLLFNACMETLRAEIEAGHFTLSHMGYFWCQGCSDYSQTAQWYVEKYLAMHENLKTELAFSEDVTFEFAGIIPVRAGHDYYTSYRQGVYADTTSKAYHESFKDLRFTGPRVAQYWMTNNPELPDIWNVCNIGEDWVWMPDGTNGVTEYFQAHYPGGTVDYTTQVQQSASWYTPTTPKAVHDSIHYNQIGYNEVGREAARNALIMLGEIEAPEVETTVKFLSWDGYTEVTEITASTVGTSGTLVVPKVYPVWKSKDVTYQLSDGLRWDYYDLLANDVQTEGTLSAVDQDGIIAISKRAYKSFRWDLVDGLLVSTGETENLATRLAGSTTDGVFVDTRYKLAEPILLDPDQNWILEWKMTGLWYDDDSTTSKKLLCQDGSSKTTGAMCLMVSGQSNRLSIGYFGTSTHISYGVNLAEYGIRVSDTHVYRLANQISEDGSNMIYLFVDGAEIGPMTRYFTGSGGDMGSDSNYLSGKSLAFGYMGVPSYLLDNGVIEYMTVMESGAASDIHFHDWTDWETVKEPGPDGPGDETRSCVCGETETREVEGVWQTLKLSEHMSPMPDAYCAGINLWAEMEHDKYFYSGGTKWGIHSSGTVYSVTIPVTTGDKIYASSFGKGGTHGGSSNGIRVTFFDAKGVNKTLAPADTYAEFTANGGYLIAPEGTVAVNIPMWNGSDSNEIYILDREHDYKGTTCTICGAEHPEVGDYSGKVISILGDSISTFAGYIPVEDGFNLEHVPRYPQDNLLTDVNETWWMQVLTELDAKLGINESWRSTEVGNIFDVEVNSGFEGTKACMASLTRIQNLGSNGTPDVILFYGGTNDITQRRTVGTFDPETAPAEVDLTSVKWDTVADAYVAAIMRMQYYYPDAEIVAMLPTFTYKNTDAVIEQYNTVFAAICAHYGVTCVDLRDCGITTADLPDGTHPDAEGMDYITDAVLDVLLTECDMEAGESVVYTVTHDLEGAEASLGYYKGVSAGRAFCETVSGDDLTVTVTMGGVDVTSEVYSGGVISIANVTGDLVITAAGREKTIYEDSLQQLPDSICCGTNLWDVLEPENKYYTSNGWGNLSTGQAWSVTIPVSQGDRLYATSFEAYGSNGNTSSTSNGIRVTYFDEAGALKALTPAETYAQFTANGGYLVVPEGAVAVNVPMWSQGESNALYILNRDHLPGEEVRENETANGSYELAVYCTSCGEELSRETVTLHIPGDINGDGNVDNKDLTRLFRHLSGYDVEVVEAALDVNGDGSINNKDQTRLFRYLSGWDVEIY